MISIKTVEHIVIGIIGCLIMLNIVLNFNRTKNDTVNVILKNWAYNKYFFITFFWGVLGGHFFFRLTNAAIWRQLVATRYITGSNYCYNDNNR